MEFIVSIVIYALLFAWVFPAVFPNSYAFRGNFWHGLLYGLFFVISGLVLVLLIGLATIATFGLALLVVLPLALLGSWIFNTLQVKLLAFLFPKRMSITSWWTALAIGLCITIVDSSVTYFCAPSHEQTQAWVDQQLKD